MIKHLLFDLDNTLYSSSYGLEQNVSARLEKFVSSFLNIPHEESEETHRQRISRQGYGTTIEWLIAEKGFTDIETYYAAINPEDEADMLPPDPALDEFLANIKLPKAILTNSTMVHADRVLDKLGIKKHFDHIFDIRFNDYKGKPHAEAFLRALDVMGADAASTLFIDDYPEFVEGFLKIGGQAVLMDEFDRYSDLSFERIKNIRLILNYL